MKRFLSVLLLSLFAAVVMAGTEVYAPTLKSPADKAVDQMPNVTISWNAIVGSTGLQYEVQLDTSSLFTSSQLADTTLLLLTGYTTHALLFATKYYWRVRAIDLGQTSGWSLVRTFTVFSKVTLTAPKNNAANDTLGPYQVLIWSNLVSGKAITGIKYYDIQADTTQNFNSPQFRSGSVASSITYFRVFNLRFGTKYYWRVRARHDLGSSSWSTVFNFTVANVLVPTLPANNAVDQMLNAKLTWKYIKGILGFDYQLARDANFTIVVAGSEVDTNFVYSEFTRFGTKYYWRVRGRHISDTMNWCNTYAFTTIDLVKLTYPSNNSTNIAVKPTMKWTKQTGIVKYQMQIDVTQDFSSPSLFQDIKLADSLTTFTVTKKMNNFTTYYWRMRAFSDSQIPDTSNWSAVWSFKTVPTTGIDENAVLTSNIYPNPASGKVNLKLDVKEPVSVQVSVVDLLGSTFIREEFDLASGINFYEINIANLNKGMYIIRLTYNGNVVNHKLIVDK